MPLKLDYLRGSQFKNLKATELYELQKVCKGVGGREFFFSCSISSRGNNKSSRSSSSNDVVEVVTEALVVMVGPSSSKGCGGISSGDSNSSACNSGFDLASLKLFHEKDIE